MIKETTMQEVRDADVVKVIGNLVEIKRAGSNYATPSPFADDKTASLMISPAKNMWKCFSSGKGGDAIKFVMEFKRIDFVSAIKLISEICNITIAEEEVSEDVKAKRDYKQQLFEINNSASNLYSKSLNKLPAEHWAKKIIEERQINEETLANFHIGFAPANFQTLTNPFIEKGKLEPAISAGLINTKEGRSFDFFVDRLVFPIHDYQGNIVGFGGRKNNNVDGPKYINTKETEIYHKSQILYGLYQAKNSITKTKTAVLCEGYTDVTALHQNGCDIAVANCGTAQLSDKQCNQIARLANHVIICRDNDGSELTDLGNFQKGIGAAMKDIDVLLANHFKVSIVVLPEGEDPDSFSRQVIDIQTYILAEAQDAVIWKVIKLKNKAANDPNALSDAIKEIAKMLFAIKNDIIRNSYIETIRKLMKQPAKVIRDEISAITKLSEKKTEISGKVGNGEGETMGLPEGADYKQFFERGYVLHENNVYFKGREKFFKGTNFKIIPLFHVYGKSDNKRLCEVISEYGKKKIIDFDTSDFVQMAKFESKLLDEGNFTFTADVSANQFKLLRNDILATFIMAYELKTLGWQQERFLAFSNVVYHGGILKKANDYGIIQLETGITNDSEYMEDVKHYYSPSASVMYKFSRDGDDPYENDRYFVYKESPVTLNEWMQQLEKVYGKKKSQTGIAFAFASLFRDIFIKRYQFFPHLFLTGEKGSGKSKFGESLVALFTFKQEAFDLNSGTLVAFTRRISRIVNVPTMMEEYHDGIDDKVFQVLKGAYDGRGREMGKATGDNRTTTTKVNTSLILLSQYLSARDDNSLTSRSIVENFIKPLESFTTAQIEDYTKLKTWEEKGMSSLICKIMEYRDFVEENLHTKYAALSKKMKKELEGKEYQERMLQNYLALLVPIFLLKPHFHFPFTEEEIWNQFKESILDSSDLIIESEGLAEFWRTLEFLLDQHRIKNEKEFKIEPPLTVMLQGRKGEAPTLWENRNKVKVMYLRLNAVHQLYHKEVSTREGVEVISEPTLKNYFRSKKYFIGAVKSHRFEDTSTSAYLFDYTMMYEMGILNLTRKLISDEDGLFEKEEADDLPY
jgi:DNA primase catalytic core